MLIITDSIIEKKKYMNRTDLTQAVLTPEVKEIGSWSFAYCDRLQTIALPDTLETIGQDIFKDCHALTYVHVYHPKTDSFCSVAHGDSDHFPTEAIGYHTDWEQLCRPTPKARLTAIAFTVFPQPELLVLTEIGSPDWMKLWDHVLTTWIHKPDDAGFQPFLAGGEEDYASILSDTASYCQNIRRQKADCIVQRLLTAPIWPIDDTICKTLHDYLRHTAETIDVLLSQEEQLYDYFKLYQTLGLIPISRIPALIAGLPEEKVELKALLMELLHKGPAENPFSHFTL